METNWFTRYGTKHEGHVSAINLAKGTAEYSYVAKCSRCGGAGGSDKWKFTGWTCFECGGNGKGGLRTEKLYSAERLAKLNVAQEKRDALRMAKQQVAQAIRDAEAKAKRAEFLATNQPLVDAMRAYASSDTFLADLLEKFEQYGTMSEAQVTAARTAADRTKARLEARAASQFVGTIGKRQDFSITVEHVIQLEAFNSWSAAPSMYLCRDDRGNRIVYKGTGEFPRKGGTGKIKATIKDHTEYKGEQQTVIARPKWLDAPVWDAETGTMKEVAL